MSFFLFLASTDYISWMFNGIRQFTAVTITFIGIKFILDKKVYKSNRIDFDRIADASKCIVNDSICFYCTGKGME